MSCYSSPRTPGLFNYKFSSAKSSTQETPDTSVANKQEVTTKSPPKHINIFKNIYFFFIPVPQHTHCELNIFGAWSLQQMNRNVSVHRVRVMNHIEWTQGFWTQRRYVEGGM